MTNIPEDSQLESTTSLLNEGYAFGLNRRKMLNTDIFQTTIMLKKMIVICGEDWARIFYDTDRFTRKKAVPERIQKSLFGKGGVHMTDGEAHQHRKKMLMSLMTKESIDHLMNLTAEEWERAIEKWEGMEHVKLFEEAQGIFMRAVSKWCGVPVPETEIKARAQDFIAMVDAFGAVGLRHWRGRWARDRAEEWMVGVVKNIRSGTVEINKDTPAYVVANHRDLNNNLLDEHTAAVELINLFRPTLAVAYFVAFAGLAIYNHKQVREKLMTNNKNYTELVAQEIRRFYPFAPFTGANVRKDFEWKGYLFKEGDQVLLDLYGTNHDSKVWDNPDKFYPERFLEWNHSAYNFIPQGGGDHYTNHRCAGEWMTISLIKQALNILSKEIEYKVPDQDLKVDLSRMPTLPKSHFIMNAVKRTGVEI